MDTTQLLRRIGFHGEKTQAEIEGGSGSRSIFIQCFMMFEVIFMVRRYRNFTAMLLQLWLARCKLLRSGKGPHASLIIGFMLRLSLTRMHMALDRLLVISLTPCAHHRLVTFDTISC